VHDGTVFLEKVERLDASASQQKSKSKGNEQFSQLPNLTAKVVHDGIAFLDQVENQKNTQKFKGNVTVNQQVNQLPNLHAKDVQNGSRFLDVVENLDQSM